MSPQSLTLERQSILEFYKLSCKLIIILGFVGSLIIFGSITFGSYLLYIIIDEEADN